MSKDLLNKLRNFLLVLLSVSLVISVFLLNKERAENQSQYEHFLNRFYIELSPIIDNLEVLTSKGLDKENYEMRLVIVEVRLSKLHTILDMSTATVTNHIHDQPSFTWYAANEGIHGIEDKEKYFKSLREVLVFVQSEMYSKETRQADPNLTVDEFNRIIEKATELYEQEIGKYNI